MHMVIRNEKPAPYGVDCAHFFSDAEQEPRTVVPGTPNRCVRTSSFICISVAINETFPYLAGVTFSRKERSAPWQASLLNQFFVS